MSALRSLLPNASEHEPLLDAELIFEDTSPDYDLLMEMREEWAPDEEEIDPEDVYHGRYVRWIGQQGKMMRVDWDQVYAFPGNPFDFEKVATFAELIRGSEAKPLLYAPPAIVNPVTLQDVVESQQAEHSEELFESHGMSRPYTTGDEELDEYLRDPDEYLAAWGGDSEEDAAIKTDMKGRATTAVTEGAGDLGKLTAQLRDGNHRAMGAQLAGEPDLWVIVRDVGAYSHVPAEELE